MTEQTTSYYDRYWTPEGHCPTGALLDSMRELPEQFAGPTAACVEIGCGDGRAAGLWLNENTDSYVGVDVSATAVARARGIGLKAIQVDDASDLPFADASFDVAVCQEVLEHLFAPQDAAAEARRVLRPGGTLVVSVPNITHWRRRLDLLVGRWNPGGDQLSVEQPWRDPHLRFFSRASLTAMLEDAGFDLVVCDGQGGSVLGYVPWLGRRVSGEPGAISRALMARLPSVFGTGLRAVARRA